MPHQSNRVTTTTQTSFGGRRPQRIGIQPIGRGRKPTGAVSITGGLGGSRLPNTRTNNIRGQLNALKKV